MVKDVIMGKEYDELGFIVSPKNFSTQVQGKATHRYILQYVKDPKTGSYNSATVLNYSSN